VVKRKDGRVSYLPGRADIGESLASFGFGIVDLFLKRNIFSVVETVFI